MKTLTENQFLKLSDPAKVLYNSLNSAANYSAQANGVGRAFLQEGAQLETPLSEETMDAFEELKKAGLDMDISKGSSMRCISIRGIRLQGVKA